MAKAKDKGGRPVGRIIKKHVAVEFHPRVADGTYVEGWSVFRGCLRLAFGRLFDLAPALLRGGVFEQIERAVVAEYPALRKSAARMWLDGELSRDAKGEPVPPLRLPTGAKRPVEVVLRFLDVLETLCYVEGMKDLAARDVASHPKTPYRPLKGSGTVPPSLRKAKSGQNGDEGESPDEDEGLDEQGEEVELDEDEAGDDEPAEAQTQGATTTS